MKKTALAKSDAKKLKGKMNVPGAGAFGKEAVVVDRREQRKRDQALGLVPFAVKIDSALAAQLRDLATERGVSLNDLTEELLRKALG